MANQPTNSKLPEAIKKEADDLATDIIKITEPYVGFMSKELHSQLIQDLCIYMVERDIKILQHARNTLDGHPND